MLNDYILEKIFSNPNVQKMSNTEQSNMIDAVEQLLSDIKEDKPYVTANELFSTTYDESESISK